MPQLKILALETSSAACSVALLVNGELITEHRVAAQQHGQLLLPMVESLLTQAELKLCQLDLLAYGQGPGSFTGLRIGCGVVQGLAKAVELPVMPISSLWGCAEAAAAATKAEQILVAVDARMQQLYVGSYQRVAASDLLQALEPDRVCAVTELMIPAGGEWLGVGSGWQQYRSELESCLQGEVIIAEESYYPDARYLCRIAAASYGKIETVSAEEAIPVYLSAGAYH